MGVHVAETRFVLHVDLPANLESLLQEFGRTGRDGLPAEAHLLYGRGDIRLRRRMIDGEERRRQEHQRLEALAAVRGAGRALRRCRLHRRRQAARRDVAPRPPVLAVRSGASEGGGGARPRDLRPRGAAHRAAAAAETLTRRRLRPGCPGGPTGTPHAASLRVSQSATRSRAGPPY